MPVGLAGLLEFFGILCVSFVFSAISSCEANKKSCFFFPIEILLLVSKKNPRNYVMLRKERHPVRYQEKI